MAAAGVISLRPASDPDVWWHLRTGEFILRERRLPGVDSWSLVAQGREWIAHEWLGEVVIALFHRGFGLFGVSLFRSLCVVILVGALALQVFRRTTPYRALLCLVLAFFATEDGWGERPQLLSFLLLIPVAHLVQLAVAGRINPFWLVPVTWFWANVHAYWILTIALLGVGVLGVLLRDGWSGGRDRAARLVTVSIACVAAAGLTPNGLALFQPLVNHAGGDPSFISEFGAPTIRLSSGLTFFAMIGVLLWLHARAKNQPDAYVVLQVVFAFAFGLLYIRTVAPAAILLTPLLADAFRRTYEETQPRGWSLTSNATIGTAVAAAVAGLLFVVLHLPSTANDELVRATAALTSGSSSPQRVLNEYGVGGWLLGRAPSTLPAIDGRAEIFPPGYVTDYLDALAMKGDWKATILPLRADSALLNPDTPLVNGLRDELGWKTAFEDERWVVLVAPDT